MGKFAAIVCSAYVLAGVILFTTGEAPVVTPGVDFLGDKFSIAWAGWKFSGCLYMALVNWGVPLGASSALAMVPYVAFDIFAATDDAHWNVAAAGAFAALELLTAAAALGGHLKVGGAINAAYVLAGVALFMTGDAPVLAPDADFFGNKFAMAWAGWKFAGCLYFALVNLGAHDGLATAIAMLPYVYFDLFALADTAHWTSLAAGFVVLDGAMGVLGLVAYFGEPKAKAA